MYTFVDFTSQIVGRRGVPCPTNKGVSYTNLVCCLAVTLKIDYYYYYYSRKEAPTVSNIANQVVTYNYKEMNKKLKDTENQLVAIEGILGKCRINNQYFGHFSSSLEPSISIFGWCKTKFLREKEKK
jgi:hypothetical protein